MSYNKSELDALRKRIEQLEGKVDPPKSTFKPMSDAEHRDWVHQMNERRMSMATPPSVFRDLNVIPDHIVKGIVQDRHAPTSATGMIPQSQQRADVHVRGSGSGYVDPRPLSPPPGIGWVDAQLIADDVRQRAKRKGGG